MQAADCVEQNTCAVINQMQARSKYGHYESITFYTILKIEIDLARSKYGHYGSITFYTVVKIDRSYEKNKNSENADAAA